MMSLHGPAKKCLAPTTVWKSEMDCPSVVLSLAYCPMDAEMSSINCRKKNTCASSPASVEVQETTKKEAMEGDSCTERNQDNEAGSAVTEEFTPSITGFSENGRQRELEEGLLKDSVLVRTKGKNVQGLETLGGGINVVPESAGESDGFEDVRMYSLMSLQQTSKLQSSQYKGVVPQPNGRWGAQIYEKHERIWLGTFNKEEDAVIAYDRAALKFRGPDAMTNFSPGQGGNLEARFMGEHSKEEFVDMLRKHSYDEKFENSSQRIIMTAARPASTNNEEPGSEGSGKRETEIKWPDDGNGNSAMAGLLREHLFEKAVTPSDVGRLNRLVIPKLHAQKYFPLVRDSIEKGSLLNFEDNSGKIWRFRYSYWKSSQSYVLTKGWNRFVKDKNLKVGDFVSFHRGSSDPRQLYITWRQKSSVRPQLGVGTQSRQSKAEFVHQGSLSSNSFNSGIQATVVGNAPWLPIVWPSSSNSAAVTQFNSNYIVPLVNEVGNFDHVSSHIPETSLNGDFSFCFSEPPAKETDQDSFCDINTDELPTLGLYLNLHNSHNSGDGSTNIKTLHTFVNPSQPSAAQELEAPEHKAPWSIDSATKQGVRLFGVSLTES